MLSEVRLKKVNILTMSILKPVVSQLVRDFLKKDNLSLSPVIGDGLCLFRSVEVSLKHQGIKALEADANCSLQTMVSQEVADNWDYYEPFCLTSKARSIADLADYVYRGKFDQTIADVCIAALCNAVGVSLTIYEEKQSKLCKTVHPPGRVPSRYTVKLLRFGSARDKTSSEHYDALLLNSPGNVPTEKESKPFNTVVQHNEKFRKAVTIPDMFRNHAIKRPRVQIETLQSREETRPDDLRVVDCFTKQDVADKAECITDYVLDRHLLSSPLDFA